MWMPTLGQVAAWEYLHLQQAKVETLTFVLEHSSYKAKRKTQTYKMRVKEREQDGKQSCNIKQEKHFSGGPKPNSVLKGKARMARSES